MNRESSVVSSEWESLVNCLLPIVYCLLLFAVSRFMFAILRLRKEFIFPYFCTPGKYPDFLYRVSQSRQLSVVSRE